MKPKFYRTLYGNLKLIDVNPILIVEMKELIIL